MVAGASDVDGFLKNTKRARQDVGLAITNHALLELISRMQLNRAKSRPTMLVSPQRRNERSESGAFNLLRVMSSDERAVL